MNKKESVKKQGRPKKEKPSRPYMVADMLDQMANGMSQSDMIKYGMRKYDVTSATAGKYVREAGSHYVQLGEGLRDSVISDVLKRLRELYDLAFKLEKFEVCLRVTDRMAHMVGVSMKDPGDSQDGTRKNLGEGDITQLTIQTISMALQNNKRGLKMLEGLDQDGLDNPIIDGEFEDG